MPAARGVKRTASKSSSSTSTAASKNKKKRTPIHLEIPTAPKRRGCVLTCGQGDVGQLGLGENVIETSKFKHVTSLGDKIVDVVAGGMHTVVLDSSGKVWTFGCNDEGALGRPVAGDAEEGKPAAVKLPARAQCIAAGDSHTAALLSDGDVYAWGAFRDSHGNMGLVIEERETKSYKEPVKINLPEQAAAIASGSDHLVILTISGSVYTMGCGEQGQLGRLPQRSADRESRQGFAALLTPMKVTLKAGASRVWAGYHATFALDGNDKMFAWGLNNYGQLGITGENRKTALFMPLECDAFAAVDASGWRQVACGQHHTLALDSDGRVYAIGRCEYGRLGLGDRTGDAEALEPIPKLQNKKCISIAAGTSSSFAVTDSGEILAWGMGSEGQLGTGTSSDATEPTPAVHNAPASCRPAVVSAGGQHTVLLAEDPTAANAPSPAPVADAAEEPADDVIEEEEEPEPEPEKKNKGRPTKRQKTVKQQQEDEISSTSAPTEAEPKPKKVKLNGDENKKTAMDVDETDASQDNKEEKPNKDIKNTETTDTATAVKPKTDVPTIDAPKTDAAITTVAVKEKSIDTDMVQTDEAESADSKPERTVISSELKVVSVITVRNSEKDSNIQGDVEMKPTVEYPPSPPDLRVDNKDEAESADSKPETTDTSSQDTVESEKTSEKSEKDSNIQGDVEMKETAEFNGTPETKVEAKTVESLNADAAAAVATTA